MRKVSTSRPDSDWAGFSAAEAVETGYDSAWRPVTQTLKSGSTAYALTQTSYDAAGRLVCTAQRMNPSAYGSLPSDACTLGTSGSYGYDRIAVTTYDNADRVTLQTSAYGVTADQANEVATTYTSNGKVATVTDAESNKTTYVYDGHDRLYQTQYPSSTKGAGTSNSSDYEQLTYDAGSTITSRRLRDGNSIGYTFDALNRMTAKDLPGSEPDVTYVYDLLSRMTSAATSSHTLSFTFDALGRNLTQVGPQGTVTSTWDIGGRRTRITHPDSFYVDYDYLVTGDVSAVRENGATSGVGVLATYGYDNLGRRTGIAFGNGTSTSYSYDAVSRLASLGHDMSGSTYDQTLGFSYTPSSQIASNTRSNDLFAWGGHGTGSTSITSNGLNQLTVIGGTSTSHDSRGNMTADSLGKTFGYSSENFLTSGPSSTTLSYDPSMRLYQVAGAATTRFQYDASSLIAEYNGSNSLQRRYVHGPGADAPIVWYEGSGTTDRRFLQADERGSVVAVSNSSGSVTNVNTYDEYGKPGSGNVGRFQYTGQKWISELGLYDYKARMYHPSLGRFLQTDPIGYGDGMNWYNYVGGNPVNRADPSGLWSTGSMFGHCPAGSRCITIGGGEPGDSDVRKMAREVAEAGQVQVPISTSSGAFSAWSKACANDVSACLRPISSYSLDYSSVAWLVGRVNRSGLSDSTIISLIWKESRFRPDENNSGAYGLMQIRQIAVSEINRVLEQNIRHKDLFVPIYNVLVGTTYLGMLVRHWKDPATALNHYGTGRGYADDILRAASLIDADPLHPMEALEEAIGP